MGRSCKRTGVVVSTCLWIIMRTGPLAQCRVSGSDAAGRPPQTAPSHSDNDHARPPHPPPTVAIPGLARTLQHVSQIAAAINWSAYIDERHTDRKKRGISGVWRRVLLLLG